MLIIYFALIIRISNTWYFWYLIWMYFSVMKRDEMVLLGQLELSQHPRLLWREVSCTELHRYSNIQMRAIGVAETKMPRSRHIYICLIIHLAAPIYAFSLRWIKRLFKAHVKQVVFLEQLWDVTGSFKSFIQPELKLKCDIWCPWHGDFIFIGVGCCRMDCSLSPALTRNTNVALWIFS